MNEVEEKELWERYKKAGDDAAREALILYHMRVVKFIAGRMAIHVPSSVEMDDLVGWGIMGLLDALEKFDPGQEIKFSTYASIRIRGAIIDQIRTLDWAPRSLRAMARKVGQTRDTLRHQKGGEPSHSEIADAMGTTEEHVEDTVAQLQTAHVLSLDDYQMFSDSEGETRKVDVPDNKRIPGPDQVAERGEKMEFVVDAILELPDQQQKVLNLYYYENLTLKEIGAVLEVTESRVCQIHSAAVKRLRKAMQEYDA